MPAMQDVKAWLAASPDHFVVKYHWEDLTPSDDGPPKLRWFSGKQLLEDFTQEERHAVACMPCQKAEKRGSKLRKRFEESREPVRILDLCSGTGAFGIAIAEGMGCRAEIKYAVEISPSAMTSFKFVPS